MILIFKNLSKRGTKLTLSVKDTLMKELEFAVTIVIGFWAGREVIVTCETFHRAKRVVIKNLHSKQTGLVCRHLDNVLVLGLRLCHI